MAGGLLLLGIAIDPVHAGAGRAPGVVDLPVQRDALGYPVVYASSVKGALKTLCARRKNCSVESDRGRIECGKGCELCCCLFGPEPGEGDKGAGRLAILDLVPLALPAPSAEHGFVYLTTPVLLSRAVLELEALEGVGVGSARQLREALEKLYEESMSLGDDEVLVLGDSGLGDSVTIGSTPLRAKVSQLRVNDFEERASVVARLGGLSRFLPKRLVVAPASIGSSLIERSLVRVTRVALRRDRKTVATGALWTEEYLPYGTIFVSGVVDTDFTNEYCKDMKDPLARLKKDVLAVQGNVFYVTVGGKETIGKGLIKFIVA